MKKIITLSCLLAAGLSFGQAFDSFTGTGALTANGWTIQSGTGPIQIVEGSLSYPGMDASVGNKIALVAGNTERVTKGVAEDISGNVYYSALINVQNTDGLYPHNTIGEHFFGAVQVLGNQGFSQFGRLYIRKGTADNTFNLGVANTDGPNSMVQFIFTDYQPGTTYLVVLKYNTTSSAASLWVNPVLGGETEPTADRTNSTGTAPTTPVIKGLTIRQDGNATTGTGNILMDEIRFGTTWADVTPGGQIAGVAENNISGFKMFPNPLTGNVLNITSDANAAMAVAIFDVLGKQVVNTVTANGTVNVSGLNAGIYIVKVTEEGKTATRKLVVR